MTAETGYVPNFEPDVFERGEVLGLAPQDYLRHMAEVSPDYAQPIQDILAAIDRKVPGAEHYPALFQSLDHVADALAGAFLEGASVATKSLIADGLYATATHLDNANVTEETLRLSNGRQLDANFYGTQPAEILNDVLIRMERVAEVTQNASTIGVNDSGAFDMHRFVDDKPGAPAVVVGIRPWAGYKVDPSLESGNSGKGTPAAINYTVDRRPIYELARHPFIGEVDIKHGRPSKLSIRAEREPFTKDTWYDHSERLDLLDDDGVLVFEIGALFADSRSLNNRAARFFALGNEKRVQAQGGRPSWNHVPNVNERFGSHDVFAANVLRLHGEYLKRRLQGAAAAKHIGRMAKVAAQPALVEVVDVLPEYDSSIEYVPPTAQEVLRQAETDKQLLEALVCQDTLLRRLIERRTGGQFDFESTEDGPLLARVADVLGPSDRTKARWQGLEDDTRELSEEESAFLVDLANHFNLITKAEELSALADTPNEQLTVLAEGGANYQSVRRRDTARWVLRNDPEAVVWQAASGRLIPPINMDGSANKEHVIVASDEVAGDRLPLDQTYTEYQTHVGSALHEGWQADIAASVFGSTMFSRVVESYAALKADNAPNVRVFQPLPDTHGRASLETAVRALNEMAQGLSDVLVVTTTDQYNYKSRLQVARECVRLGRDDQRVTVVGQGGERSAAVYEHELANICRMLAA